MLALANHIERLVEDGELPSYAAAARTLGLTRARLTQVVNLLLLSPMIQERILLEGLDASERSLRPLALKAEWDTTADTRDTDCVERKRNSASRDAELGGDSAATCPRLGSGPSQRAAS